MNNTILLLSLILIGVAMGLIFEVVRTKRMSLQLELTNLIENSRIGFICGTLMWFIIRK